MKKGLVLVLALVLVGMLYSLLYADGEAHRILVFSKTEGYRHSSIVQGKAAWLRLGAEQGFAVDTTEDASVFSDERLRTYHAVVFLNTTGDVLNEEQQVAFMRYIQAGGGFVGIHSATDTEYGWPWYGRLVGAYFDGHPSDPNVRDGVVQVADGSHLATRMLPNPWPRTDEWYDFRSQNPDVHVLLRVDERSYKEHVEQEDHPVAWYHAFDGGRAFYTAMGHTGASFSEPLYLQHVLGGLRYVIGDGAGPDYERSTLRPHENRFSKVVLDYNLTEPMELEVLPDDRLLFVERRGAVKIYDPVAQRTETIATLDVFHQLEEGLLGVALDPDYETNHWIYVSYSAPDVPEIRLARFVLEGSALDPGSEKVLLRVPVQREECCHVGGSVEFDAAGNLYLSVGDNTNPFASDGFAPIDERPGRSAWDAQKSASNPNDLRGKILRIHPEPDGTASIPDGNLFPKDGSAGRPEIYVMGDRNPFRISIDAHTGYLYWGEVGPDAGEDRADRGPRGHDEINQARAPGFFGWPYFVGDNKPYYAYDFATGTPGAAFDPERPVNDSPNNTGAEVLPPAQPAFIWYPYDASAEFPIVGDGGRTSMAGPVYYADDYPEAARTFAPYYDRKLFVYDWIRGWIMAVTMDADGDYAYMERFMPGTTFSNPVDMAFGDDGRLYVLEYGTSWNTQNLDARLVRIDYQAGNRAPVARIEAEDAVGAAPLTVSFSGLRSEDPDGDGLSYAWSFDGDAVQSTEPEPEFTFEGPGRYAPRLTVTDQDGLSATATTEVIVGNTLPEVTITLAGNRTFFWDGRPIAYSVDVTDAEDGSLADGGIDPGQVALTVDYLAQGFDRTVAAQGHEAVRAAVRGGVGRTLIEQSDCLACHKVADVSIGPSYTDVARRYAGDEGARQRLAAKVISGGGGVWGERAMAAHPQLSQEQAEAMVAYILSLAEEDAAAPALPASGVYTPHPPEDADADGRYLLTASYTDRGDSVVGSLTGYALLTLRPARIQAEAFDAAEGVTAAEVPDDVPGMQVDGTIAYGPPGAYAVYRALDLTGVARVTASVGLAESRTLGGALRLRLDRPDGPDVGLFDVTLQPDNEGFQVYETPLEPTDGVHDLYLVFHAEEGAGASDPVCAADWLFFHPAER